MRRCIKLPAKEPVSRRVKTLLLFSSITSCESGDMKKGISSESSERIDDELRLHSYPPLCFFAACVESAVVAPSGSATPFSRLDAVSTLITSAKQHKLASD